MAWITVEDDGKEYIFSDKPSRGKGLQAMWNGKSKIKLAKGSILKLINTQLTWDDEPVELVETKDCKCAEEHKQLNELAIEINQHVKEKGFWQSMYDVTSFLELHEHALNKNTIKATKDAFIAQKIALVGTELSEAVESMRKTDYEANGYGIGVKDSFADEIADTIIRLLDLCGELQIDIDTQIKWKMLHNRSRAEKHGKEF